MRRDYGKGIEEASTALADAILAHQEDWINGALELDGEVLSIMRAVGATVLTMVLGELAEAVTAAAALPVHRRSTVNVVTVLGRIPVPSPYLWNAETKASARPVKDQLGLYGRCKTPAVQRALVDFGIEESFELASQRFYEHYGIELGRTSMLRVVESCAQDAETFVEERLEEFRKAFDEPIAKRAGADLILVELDGSMVRTGTLGPAANQGRTPVRQLPSKKREEAWREVRVGFARKPEEVDRTYVARMDKYPRVADDLFSAAVGRGLSSNTDVFAVGDGGNGLRDELAIAFDRFTFLLDRPHLKGHLFETAEALNLTGSTRAQWVEDALLLVDHGKVGEFIDILGQYKGAGEERATRLAGYLERFADALDYRDAYNRGLPLGSGEVESAHRYIPQKRLKLPGACWSPDTINPMLALRALRANGWWDDFWEHRRPGKAA